MYRARTSRWLVVLVLAVGCLALLAPATLLTQADTLGVVINEVAWAGTAASSSDEWIELFNPGDQALDLTGWILAAADGSPTIPLVGNIAASGTYLLERSDDSTISDWPADLIFTGSLGNGGEILHLWHADGTLVDTANGDGGGWPAGTAGPDFRSMERTDSSVPGDDPNWHSNGGLVRNGLDANGQPINGTPGQPNSAPVPPTATPSPTASPTPTTAALGGFLFEDADADGVYEPWLGETGFGGVLVILSDGRSRLTGPTGFYGWRNLAPGEYTVRLVQPIHTIGTTPNQFTVTVAAGEERFDLHFGQVILPPDQVQTTVSLNEFLPSPASDWNGDGTADADDEWIELFNAGNQVVDLGGWFLDDVNDGLQQVSSPDGSPPYLIPPGTVLPAGGFLLFYRSTTAVALNNGGDTVRLLGPGYYQAEAFLYGATGYDRAWSKTIDGGDQWSDLFPPSPGNPNLPGVTPTATRTPSPTATATPTPGTSPTGTATPLPNTTPTPTATLAPSPVPTATATPVPSATLSATVTATVTPVPSVTLSVTATPHLTGISLNEFLPDPASDWDGDGSANAEDEYVELFNANPFPVDLTGWFLDDVDDGDLAGRPAAPGGSRPYPLPPGTLIPAHGFLLLFRSQTGVVLNNDGDWVRLLGPQGISVEETEYATAQDDQAYSKTADGGTLWTTAFPPSPGGPNLPGPSPTSTASATPASTITPSATSTVPATFTPSPAAYPTGVTLNEFLPNPISDWDGDGIADAEDEYVELFNDNSFAVDLAGWFLDDVDDGDLAAQDATGNPAGGRPYPLPPGTIIPARGFLLLFRSQTGVALNNDGDWVRLLRPDGVQVDAHDYASSTGDGAYSRTQEGGSIWTTTYPPSPGAPNRPSYGPNDRVRLNEILASPKAVDWDGDGQASYLDEWIELFNAGPTRVNLAGWMLSDGPPPDNIGLQGVSGRIYILPAGTLLEPGGFLVIYRRQSGLALDAGEEWVRLSFPDSLQADGFHADRFSGYDRSWCRLPDGEGGWTLDCDETPGLANRPRLQATRPAGGSEPLYDRFNHDLATVSHARTLPDGTRVTVEGQVTVLPGLLDPRQAYIQDNTGGILVYLRSGQWPELAEGQWIRVNGPMDSFHSEREVRLTRIDDIKTLMPGNLVQPLPITTGLVGEAHEGRLVQLRAPVNGYWGSSTLYLDDGSGQAQVTLRLATGITRPFVLLGEPWTVIGVVSQWDDEPPFQAGYRLLPRRPSDLWQGLGVARADFVDAAPLLLPITGAAAQTDLLALAMRWRLWLLFLSLLLIGTGLWLRAIAEP